MEAAKDTASSIQSVFVQYFFVETEDHTKPTMEFRLFNFNSLLWAFAYLLLFLFFHLATSPLVSGKRFNISPYLVIYFLCSLWIAAGIFGHTPWWDQNFDFNVDEPASLLMPMFWGGLFLLLFIDLIHYTIQRSLRQLKCKSLYLFCSTKVRTSFGRTFSESAIFSISVAGLCCMLHARNITTTTNSDYLYFFIQERNQTDRFINYWENGWLSWYRPLVHIFCNTTTTMTATTFDFYQTMPKWVASPIFGVWLSCMSIKVVHQLFDRACEERGALFLWSGADRPTNSTRSSSSFRSPSFSSTSSSSILSSPRKGSFRGRSDSQSSFGSVTSTKSTYSTYSNHSNLDSSVPRGEAGKTAIVPQYPQNMKPMAIWYEYSLAQTIMDLFIHASIFAGRFDMRHLLGKSTHFDDCSTIDIGTLKDPYYFNHTNVQMANSTSKLQNENRNEDHQQNDEEDEDEDENENENENQSDMWFDFIADCGDGFDSSYSIARLLAQPSLTLNGRTLKRGQILLIGGDLCYPNPTNENFEERFLRVFDDAMPSPLEKPPYYEEWPPSFDKKQKLFTIQKNGFTDQPCCYVIPGNHDWFDGLASYMRYILSRDFLGGWYLPQEKSYFALELPSNWYIFGMDDGLDGQIDSLQFQYFYKICSKLNNSANVIILNHHPNWVLDDYESGGSSHHTRSGRHRNGKRRKRAVMQKGLEYLMETVLKSKVKLRIAGDVHNYMRHAPSTNFGDDNKHEMEGKEIPKPMLVISGGGGAFLHPTHCLGNETLHNVAGTNHTSYDRVVCYPNEKISSSLSIQNLFQFRKRNWKFDAIGGLLYLAIAHPLFSGCTLASKVVQYSTNTTATTTLSSTMYNTFQIFLSDVVLKGIPSVLSSSTLSCIVIFMLWFVLVRAVDHQKLGIQFWWGTIHLCVHVLFAIGITVFIDTIFEHLNIYGNLGNGGINLQWNIFINKFPSGHNTVQFIGSWTLNIVPSILRYSMYVADSAQTQYLVRGQMCHLLRQPLSTNNIMNTVDGSYSFFSSFTNIFDSNFASIRSSSSSSPFLNSSNGDGNNSVATKIDGHFSDQLRVLYFTLRIVWYWILACPIVSTIVASYLYFSVGWLNMHWNEGFSSIQNKNYKNFLRMKIDKRGDLELFVVGIDKVPSSWILDPEYMKNEMGNIPSHRWKKPSKWIDRNKKGKARNEINMRLVDRVIIRATKNIFKKKD